jgi:hypothetical protein
MTRIARIDAELFGLIRDDPRHPHHPRSIDAFFRINHGFSQVREIGAD